MDKRQAAKQKMYQRAMVRELNLIEMRENLFDMAAECSDVRYFCEGVDDSLLEELIGSEDEAYEFKMLFSTLCDDVEKMLEDFDAYEEMLENFDDFLVSIKAAVSYGTGLLGFDSYENDYFPLGVGEDKAAEYISTKRLKRMTKEQIIESAILNFRVAISYIGIKNRYDNLKAAIDILRGENAGFLQQIRNIEEAYNKAEREHFLEYSEENRRFDRLICSLPDVFFIQ